MSGRSNVVSFHDTEQVAEVADPAVE